MDNQDFQSSKDAITSRNQKLQHIFELLQKPEYGVLREHIDETKQVIVQALLRSKNLEEVRELQAKHAAFDSILTSIEYFSQEFESNNRELEELALSERLTQNYGA